MDMGQHDVRRALGEKAAPFDGRQLERVAQDQDRPADARVAEDAKHLGLALFEPLADLVDRVRLLARPFAADRARRWGLSCAGWLRAGHRIVGGWPLFGLSARPLRLGGSAAARTNPP